MERHQLGAVKNQFTNVINKTDTKSNIVTTHTKHDIVTNYVDEKYAKLSPTDKGKHDPKNIPGYHFIRTEIDKRTGDITHVYHRIVTNWVTTKGKHLKDQEFGAHEPGSFNGYRFVRTEVAENGDITHIFEEVPAPVNTPRKPKMPTTGAASNAGALVASGLLATVAGVFRRKRN